MNRHCYRFQSPFRWALSRLGRFYYSRAYLSFKTRAAMCRFATLFDGHIFQNKEGVQHRGVVEIAPSQKRLPKQVRQDRHENTIEEGLFELSLPHRCFNESQLSAPMRSQFYSMF